MFRLALSVLLLVSAPMTTVSARDVQTVGDVSFAVPEGWQYKPGADFGGLVLSSGQNFWLIAVYTAMPSSGNAEADLQAAWKRIVLAGPDYQGMPARPYYDINHSVGYPGKRADDSAVNRATYTRLYVLEAGSKFIPVVAVSREGTLLNQMEHVANDVIGSVRLAPLKAQPIRTSITVADLAGHWVHGMWTSTDYYSTSTGQYARTDSAFYGAGYTISPNGSFTYKMSGMVNGRVARDDDSGTVQLSGSEVIFKGRNHVVRYRFVNLQQALNGSTVLTLLPGGVDMASLSMVRDRDQWSREPKK